MKIPRYTFFGEIRARKQGRRLYLTPKELRELMKDEWFGRYYPKDLTSIPKGYVGIYLTKTGIIREVIVKNA